MAHVVGTSARRKEGPEKLAGHARYVDDYRIPGCLHGATLRSRIARGRILRLVLDPGFDWESFVVATAADVPGRNVVSLIEEDQPLLADGEVRHALEPIALVAHADRARAYEALAHIEVEYEPLEAVLLPESSEQVFKSFLIERGDVAAGLAAADVVVEGEYQLPHQEQAYIENNGAACWFEADGTLVVLASHAVPLLRPQGDEADLRPARRQGARDPGRDRGRLRRQGGVPEPDRRPRGAARQEVGPAGEDHLRPPRGHARDDQAAPGADPPPHRRQARRKPGRPGHRDRDGRRRLPDALARRALARHAARHRPLRLRERADPLAGGRDEHPAQRRLPRLRRAADAVRGRAAHGADRRGDRARSGGAAPQERRARGLDAARSARCCTRASARRPRCSSA